MSDATPRPDIRERVARALYAIYSNGYQDGALRNAVSWEGITEGGRESWRAEVDALLSIVEQEEPVAWTHADELEALRHGLDAAMGPAKDGSYDVPLYARSAPTGAE